MTKADFLREYGGEWRKFARKPIFEALLTAIDAESPAKKEPPAEGDKLHGAAVFLNRIYGWENLRAMLVSLSDEPNKEQDVPDTFKEPEV